MMLVWPPDFLRKQGPHSSRLVSLTSFCRRRNRRPSHEHFHGLVTLFLGLLAVILPLLSSLLSTCITVIVYTVASVGLVMPFMAKLTLDLEHCIASHLEN